MLPILLSTLLATAGDNPAAKKPETKKAQSFQDKMAGSQVGIAMLFSELGIIPCLDTCPNVLPSYAADLLSALQGREPQARAVASSHLLLLAKMAQTGAWLDGKRDGSRRLRFALGDRASSFEASLINSLKDANARVRFMAGASLLVLDPNNRQARQAVVAGLQRMDPDYLETIGPLRLTQPEIISCLVDALEHKSGKVRRAAATAVMQIGPSAKPAVPGLVALLKSKEAVYQGYRPFCALSIPRNINVALDALGVMGASAAPAVPILIDILNDSASDQRADTLTCLARIGPGARKAAEAVRKLCSDRDDDVRLAACCAMLRILPGDEQALSIMKTGLRSRKQDNRMRALEACTRAGLKEKALVPEFIRVLQQQDERLRDAAADAIAEVGPDAETAIPDLTKIMLNERSNHTWNNAAGRALVAIGKASVPALIKVAEQKECAACGAALYFLGSFEGETHHTVPVLVNGLIDLHYRLAATIALGRLGREAREASLALMIVCLVDIFAGHELWEFQYLEYWALAQTMQ